MEDHAHVPRRLHVADPELPGLESLGPDLLSTTRAGSAGWPWPGRSSALPAYAAAAVLGLVVADAGDRLPDLRGRGHRHARRRPRLARPRRRGRPNGPCSRSAPCCWRAATPIAPPTCGTTDVFPGPDDPEGDPARYELAGRGAVRPVVPAAALVLGLPAEPRPADQRALAAGVEAAWALAVPAAGLLLLPWTPAVLVYAALAVVGSWVYPLLTVHLPHHDYGATPLTQTGTLRGRLIPALFLELTYHLEHHLYPAVPSHHLAELSRRLDPFFQAAGVKPRRVP